MEITIRVSRRSGANEFLCKKEGRKEVPARKYTAATMSPNSVFARFPKCTVQEDDEKGGGGRENVSCEDEIWRKGNRCVMGVVAQQKEMRQ